VRTRPRTEKNGFVSATKLGTTNNFFVAATKNFAAATKRFVDRTKHFVGSRRYSECVCAKTISAKTKTAKPVVQMQYS